MTTTTVDGYQICAGVAGGPGSGPETLSQRGWFRNEERERMGGLWFQGDTLMDYDGMVCLPRVVINHLRHLGWKVCEACAAHPRKCDCGDEHCSYKDGGCDCAQCKPG